MAKSDNIFDIARGKLGNLVFYKVGDSGRIRTRAVHFHDRKSPAQLAQRQRLQVATAFLGPFRHLIRITFSSEAKGRSAMQAAQSFNMRNALEGEYPDIHINKHKALLSSGPLPLPVHATVTPQPEGLLIEWENGSETEGLRAYDTLLVSALLPDTASTDHLFTGARRKEGRYLWKPSFPADKLAGADVWIAFRNSQETQMSNSMYVTQ